MFVLKQEQELSEWQELRLGLETRTLPLAPSLPLSLPSPIWDETFLWPCDCYPLPISLTPSSSPAAFSLLYLGSQLSPTPGVQDSLPETPSPPPPPLSAAQLQARAAIRHRNLTRLPLWDR